MSVTEDLENNIRSMADKLRPALPDVRNGPPGVTPAPNASTVAKRLEKAISEARELEKMAVVLGIAIAGPSPTNRPQPNEVTLPDYLFGKQMAALDALQAAHERIRLALERIGNVLQ